MTAPRITAIVPVWNGAGQIGRLLDALAAQTLPEDRFDVVIVDNGSSDDTCDVVRRYPFAKLISEPRPGSYQARNSGMDHVTTDYVAFTDADCVPRADWLENALAAIASNPGAGVIAGRVELFDTHERGNAACKAYEQLFSMNQETYAAHGTCATANWTSRIALLREMGGFDAALKSGGDFKMAQAIKAAGHAIVYRADVVVGHPLRGDYPEFFSKRLRVLGGHWTKAREAGVSPFRFALSIMGTNLRRVRTIVSDRNSDIGMKARMLLLVAIVTLASYGELARLLMGGAPRRA